MPLVWQLQLKQRDNFMNQLFSISDTQNSDPGPQAVVANSSGSATQTTKATVQVKLVNL